MQAGLVLDRTQIRLQQTVEHPRLGPCALGAAVGAGHVRELDRVGVGDLLALGILLAQRVVAEPLVARLALDQRIDELLEVTGGLPHFRRKDDR